MFPQCLKFELNLPLDKWQSVSKELAVVAGVGEISRIDRSDASLSVLSFKVPFEATGDVMEVLHSLGVGTDFGYVDILPVLFSLPSFGRVYKPVSESPALVRTVPTEAESTPEVLESPSSGKRVRSAEWHAPAWSSNLHDLWEHIVQTKEQQQAAARQAAAAEAAAARAAAAAASARAAAARAAETVASASAASVPASRRPVPVLSPMTVGYGDEEDEPSDAEMVDESLMAPVRGSPAASCFTPEPPHAPSLDELYQLLPDQSAAADATLCVCQDRRTHAHVLVRLLRKRVLFEPESGDVLPPRDSWLRDSRRLMTTMQLRSALPPSLCIVPCHVKEVFESVGEGRRACLYVVLDSSSRGMLFDDASLDEEFCSLFGALPPEAQHTRPGDSRRSSTSDIEVEPPDVPDDYVDPEALDLRSRDELDWKGLIGVGRFGRVYMATHIDTGRTMAVKVIDKCQVEEQQQLENVKKEKAIFRNLAHPFVVKFYGSFHDQSHVYFMMEHLTGGDFSEFLLKTGTLQEEDARFYTAQLVLAIEYLHSRFIIYRDLKPENILLDSLGHVRIADFGFAKTCRDRTKTLLGTPEYIAPEIIASKGYGREVDWWSLGIVLYEMLAGETPFNDGNDYTVYGKVMKNDVNCPDDWSPELRDIVLRLLCKNDAQRLGSYQKGPGSGGASEIKEHPFFDAINWDDMMNKRVTPPFDPSELSFERMLLGARSANTGQATALPAALKPAVSPLLQPSGSWSPSSAAPPRESTSRSRLSASPSPELWADF